MRERLRILLLCLAVIGLVGSTADVATAKAPSRHVLCGKAATWIPMEYDGGCYVTFTQAVRRIAYDAFAEAAQSETQWRGSSGLAQLNIGQIVASMKCSRGGSVNLIALNRWQAGLCTWTETFGHYDLGDHPVHEWTCEITVAVRTSMSGKVKRRKGRVWMEWSTTAAPVDDVSAQPGEFPHCGKDADDNWS